MRVRRRIDCDWISTDLAELTTNAGSGRHVTLIYIHGNRVSSGDAISQGMTVYRRLAVHAPDDLAIRFVIWSWPSDKVRGQIRDVRAKGVRTNNEGYFLGWFLSRLPSDASVSLLGYSYGARIATGALHVAAGGSLAGCSLRDEREEAAGSAPNLMRVALLAAAIDRCWIMPGQPHGRALGLADEMLLLYNHCDPVLKRYGVVEKGSHPEALGYQGIGASCLGPDGDRLSQRDVCCTIGKTHDVYRYLYSPSLTARMSSNLFWESGLESDMPTIAIQSAE